MSSYGIVDSLFYVCCVVCEAGVVVVVVVDVEGAMVSSGEVVPLAGSSSMSATSVGRTFSTPNTKGPTGALAAPQAPQVSLLGLQWASLFDSRNSNPIS